MRYWLQATESKRAHHAPTSSRLGGSDSTCVPGAGGNGRSARAQNASQPAKITDQL